MNACRHVKQVNKATDGRFCRVTPRVQGAARSCPGVQGSPPLIVIRPYGLQHARSPYEKGEEECDPERHDARSDSPWRWLHRDAGREPRMERSKSPGTARNRSTNASRYESPCTVRSAASARKRKTITTSNQTRKSV